jgi:formiminotetrahydrofolate cyclodeaminase
MRQTPVLELLNSFAARTPTPGGGSASALGGALGSALASMAAAFTTQNEKYKAVECGHRGVRCLFRRARIA